ncbi:MAG TPA: response regulator [Sphingobacteriaceae bacterium]
MKRVVVVDADTDFTNGLKQELSGYDFEIKAISDPENIFEVIARNDPDLVLVNYILNDGNGGTISHQIKSDPQTHDIPVIMMSDYSDLRTLWKKFGCNDYVLKPFNTRDLVEKMNFWLRNVNRFTFSH